MSNAMDWKDRPQNFSIPPPHKRRQAAAAAAAASTTATPTAAPHQPLHHATTTISTSTNPNNEKTTQPQDIVFDSSVRDGPRQTEAQMAAGPSTGNNSASQPNNNSNKWKPSLPPEEISIFPSTDGNFFPPSDSAGATTAAAAAAPDSNHEKDGAANTNGSNDDGGDDADQGGTERREGQQPRTPPGDEEVRMGDTIDGVGDPSTLRYTGSSDLGLVDNRLIPKDDTPVPVVRAPSGFKTPDANLAVETAAIPQLIGSLVEAKPSTHEIALRKLMASFWMHGDEARTAFVENGGIPAWTSTIWHDMSDEETQLAALEMLFSLATSAPESDYPWLATPDLDHAIDALLIMMQTLIGNKMVQSTGCRVLGALAAVSGRNAQINDGSMSGAVNTVLNAVDAHPRAEEIREWGVRALFLQCSSSRQAQINRTTLVNATLDTRRTGPMVIAAALEASTDSLFHSEWCCLLYWCLSSSPQAAKKLSLSMDGPMQTMIDLARNYGNVRGASMLLESSLGAINNFCMVNDSLQLVDKAELVALALEIVRYHKEEDAVSTEAYALIANIAPGIPNKGYFAQGAVDIAKGLLKNNSTMELNAQIEALRALNSVISESDVVQEKLWSNVSVASVIEISRLHVDSESWQGLSCSLFANLIAGGNFVESQAEKRLLSELCLAMSRHADSPEVQEVASAIVCRVSNDPKLSPLLQDGLLGQTISAMSKFHYLQTLQINGCTTFCNVASNGILFQVPSVMERCAVCLVNTLQNDLEKSSVVQAACNAMWTFVHRSANRKQIIAKAGGIDLLTCALVMHQKDISVLEKTCGVLSSFSASNQLIPSILNAQGISSIVDAIRNNPDSQDIIQYGSVFLKNVIIADSTQAEATSDVISVIVSSMRKHENNADLQRQACGFLWAVASTSPSCKARVLKLDAVTILMSALSHKDKNVQAAARGAFNEIALTGSGSSSGGGGTGLEAGQ